MASQTKITEYFEEICEQVETEMEALMKSNVSFRESLEIMRNKFEQLQQTRNQVDGDGNKTGELLKRMMEQCQANEGRNSGGLRFKDEVLNRFCMNLWILGGRRMYEILHANLRGIFPSPRTVEAKLSGCKIYLPEGSQSLNIL